MKSFLSDRAFERIATHIEPNRSPPVSERDPQDLQGNQAVLEHLAIASGDGFAARTETDELHVLESIVGAEAAPPVGSSGILLQSAWRDELESFTRGDAALGGERAVLEEYDAGPTCGGVEECRHHNTTYADQLRHTFDRAAVTLENRLVVQARTLLGKPTLVTAMSGEFGAWAGTGAATLFSTAGSAVGGAAGGAIGGFVGGKVRQAVTRNVNATGSRLAKARVLDDAAIGGFFTNYMLGWHTGLTEALITYGSGDVEVMQAFNATLRELVGNAAAVVETVQAHILPPFLALGATSATSTDAFGRPTGVYDFKLMFSHDGEGDARPVALVMPTALAAEDASLLLDVPGLLTSQLIHLVSEDRRVQAKVAPDGRVTPVQVDPSRRELLQVLGAGDPAHVRRLRYDASQVIGQPGGSSTHSRPQPFNGSGCESRIASAPIGP